MPGLWIDDTITKLKRTPAERLLLARICYRAGIAKDELCHDSNKELALAIDIHAQSVSDLIRKLEKDGLITTKIYPEKKNARTISAISEILIPYKENAYRYKEKADSHYKEIPYSGPEGTLTLSGISLDPISQILTPSNEIPYSYNKDIKPLEKEEENKVVNEVAAIAASAADKKNSESVVSVADAPLPTPLTPPPKAVVGDGQLRAECLEYNANNPGKYSAQMYKDFLRYWTAPIQTGKKSEIGKELWRTQKTWDLAGRLSRWRQNETNDEQRNQPNGRKSSDFLNRQRSAEPAKNGYGSL